MFINFELFLKLEIKSGSLLSHEKPPVLRKNSSARAICKESLPFSLFVLKSLLAESMGTLNYN